MLVSWLQQTYSDEVRYHSCKRGKLAEGYRGPQCCFCNFSVNKKWENKGVGVEGGCESRFVQCQKSHMTSTLHREKGSRLGERKSLSANLLSVLFWGVPNQVFSPSSIYNLAKISTFLPHGVL